MKGLLGNRGAAVVEFAVLFLLLMIIVFGIIEFGFIWLQSHYIANSAREGARVAARVAHDPKISNEDKLTVENAVKEYLKGLYSDDRVDGTGAYSPPNGGCCGSNDFIYVTIDGEAVIEAGLGEENPDAVKVSVTVQIDKVWKPILWDLLKLINPDAGDIPAINAFAVFAFES